MKPILTKLAAAAACILLSMTAHSQNPFLPMWEYIPDGEPYVFEDPDNPGQFRVYVYGSHDMLVKAYCGLDQVVWSAPVDDLTAWRYDGVIFESKTDANGDLLRPDGTGDVLYAPDVVESVDKKTGRKTYYLYPNNQAGGRQSMVAKADRPDGPFKACNWDPSDPKKTVGVLGFDPAVLIDNGRVYGYWGINNSYGAELDPKNMASLKKGRKVIRDMVSGREQEGDFRFFEASSIRKIEDKYVFIYSRWTKPGEFGLGDTNYTLAYSYSDKPLGPWTYGGTIIDGRGRDTDENGQPIYTGHQTGNTHGSICEINGRWFVFYHRQTGLDEYSRQAMAAPVTVKVEKGKGGRVRISEAEYTSEGFALEGLDPSKRWSAGIACYYTGPELTEREFPNYTFSGSYIQPWKDRQKIDHNPVVNNTSGSVVGFKYFNLSRLSGSHQNLVLEVLPQGVEGRIEVWADSPWASRGGILLGTAVLDAAMSPRLTDIVVSLGSLKGLAGKRAIYLRFISETKGKSLCELHHLQFTDR